LKILNEVNILTVKDFLLKFKNNTEDIMGIITDLIDDSENCIVLIENILTSNSFESEFYDCCRNYANDVIVNQDLITKEFITAINGKLKQQHFEAIFKRFLSDVFESQFNACKELTEVISNQKEWNKTFKNFHVLHKIFKNIFASHSEFICKELIGIFQSKNDANYYFLLMALNYIDEDVATTQYNELKSKVFFFINQSF
jgi:hypothetical protein